MVTVHLKAPFAMKIGENHLSYCTNVHPAETFAELVDTLQNDVLQVKQQVSGDQPFGVGLRLSAQMVLSMNAEQKAELIETLLQNDLYVFSVNAFPYGDFGVGVVKASVYEPGWDDKLRSEYTKSIADILVALPGDARRSISTVALGFAEHFKDESRLSKALEHLHDTCRYLARLHKDTGIFVDLCLEPEPGTYLETSKDVIQFFTAHWFPSEGAHKSHLSVCYDTCHQAVMFEDAVTCLESIHKAGVRIGKMQVSNAISVPSPKNPEQRKALFDFDEPRFLHQVVAQEGQLFALDLPAVDAQKSHWLNASEWRCHFHVPLHWPGSEMLETTASQWRSALNYALEQQLCHHYEIETYTWSVLPEHARGILSITDGISAEFQVVRPFFDGVSS